MSSTLLYFRQFFINSLDDANEPADIDRSELEAVVDAYVTR